jgi:hypothetical protein
MVRAHPSQQGRCPDAAQLAAFFEGALDRSQRSEVVAHVARCRECRAALGALGQMSPSELPVIPRELLEAAAGRSSPHLWRGRAAAVLAAAASVLFAVAVTWQSPGGSGNDDSPPALATPSERPDDVRARAGAGTPQLMEPKVGATLSMSTRFEWTPVEGAVQYQLHVLTGTGDIVLDEATTATTLEMAHPGDRPGPYYAWVSALLTDGRRVQSPVVRLAGPAR